MAPRANWKGFLRLSLVTCPVAIFPATSETEKVSFNQISKKTGHRIKYQKVDAETGEEVEADDIVKGYQIDKGVYVEITKGEIESIALESTHTIDIDEFVPRDEIDSRFLIRPYYVVPDGKVGHDAYAVIRDTIRKLDRIALARIVLTNREHIIALEPLGKGLMGMLLRYPYEIRDEAEYFDDIKDVKITKEMLDLASHIVETKSGHFEPDKFEDQYETALIDLINKKRSGEVIRTPAAPTPSNVISLMDALRQSLAGEKQVSAKARPKRARKRVEGQKEMLFPISGKGGRKAPARQTEAASRKSRGRKAG